MPQRLLTIASPHVVYRSNWLERTPEIKDLLSLTVDKLNYLESFSIKVENGNTVQDTIRTSLLSSTELREIEAFFYLFMRDFACGFKDPFDIEKIGKIEKIEETKVGKKFRFDPPYNTLRHYLNAEYSLMILKKNLYQAIRETNNEESISFIEKVILASFFLDKDQMMITYNQHIHENICIHDLIQGGWEFAIMQQAKLSGISVSLSDEYPEEDPYDNDKSWKIPLPGFSRETPFLPNSNLEIPNSNLEESINRVINTTTVATVGTDELVNRVRLLLTTTTGERSHLRTESYYYINKRELMERVKSLLRKLFNDVEPKTMDEIGELYERLLNLRGAFMWETASLQFPEDEVIFLWNRSMISQSLERAWYLPLTPVAVNDSISNFTVTHHRMVRHGDRLIPTMNAEVWTKDELRDVLGHDWMFDQGLILEDDQKLISDESLINFMRENSVLGNNWIRGVKRYDWINIKRFIDLEAVKRIVSQVISSNLSINGRGFLTKTGSNRLFLEEFSPEQALRHLNNSEPMNLLDLLPRYDEVEMENTLNALGNHLLDVLPENDCDQQESKYDDEDTLGDPIW